MPRPVKILLAMVCFSLTACASSENYQAMVNTWQGAKLSTLLADWGQPTEIGRDLAGNRKYIFVRQHTRFTTPASAAGDYKVVEIGGHSFVQTTGGTLMGTEKIIRSCTTWFVVNRRNVIIRTHFMGNNCLATQSDIKRLGM